MPGSPSPGPPSSPDAPMPANTPRNDHPLMAQALWSRHLKHNPAAPKWADRDRFVLSNGHGSMLIYALLHLTGYALSIDELRNFRQMHSLTPGHPEVDITPGVETTTGPLGQGITNAVGMALAEKLLASEFNRDGHTVVDHRTYVFMGDGCLMEGISHEAVALAGAWKLNKLIALYDDNGISIDGQVTPWFIDNTPQRFQACGWNVIGPVDGHDVDAGAAGAAAQAEWEQRFTAYSAAHPELAQQFIRRMAGELPSHFAEIAVQAVAAAHEKAETVASRKASQLALEHFTAQLPELLGVSADLTGSNLTNTKSTPNLRFDAAGAVVKNEAGVGGRHINYGVREFGMAAIMNGIALHGGYIPYGGDRK